ncbi:hypothetical protein MKW92_046516, partial [Papaver armeniacum]
MIGDRTLTHFIINRYSELLSRVQRQRLIGSSLPVKSSVAKYDSTPAKYFGQTCGVHTISKEPTLVEKMFQELLSRVQRQRLIGSSLLVKSSVAKYDSTPAKYFGQTCGVHTISKEPTLVEKMFQ